MKGEILMKKGRKGKGKRKVEEKNIKEGFIEIKGIENKR